VGVETAKTLAQVTGAPLLAIASIDALAYAVRYTARTIVAVIDGRRHEVFSAIYPAVPGGVLRLAEPVVQRPEALVAEVEARPGEGPAGGGGGLLYRDMVPAGRVPG